ncbi:MAG: adenosyl-hopene transferase HpnH [Dehalococcoidia bacterium]|nr:adenosyl-hopene transferase HpnH [Dehalococcoidia bacterium]
MKRASRPMELSVRLAFYILKNRLKGRKRFPMVTMLEPLEMCNLACVGCGRIHEYKPVMDKMMSVEEAIAAVEASAAPIVSVAGGEPTIHPKIDQILNELVRRKYFVYCCTNGILLERVMKKVPPSKYLSWVVHMDGMEERHDEAVARKGVFRKAISSIEAALDNGYRVCTNTTIFRGCDVEDLHNLFQTMTKMGVEGCMVSPGYDYTDAPDHDIFLTRQESQDAFKEILDEEKIKGLRMYNNPLYLNFLRGRRDYQCTAWSNPTYTVMGWRKPCYPLADEHIQNVDELFESSLWDKYGVGKDPRCAGCMMHCGFESATIFNAVSSPKDWVTLVKAGSISKSGITAG